jgi:hypothetical protein
MSIWQKYTNDKKLVMLQQTAAAKKIFDCYFFLINHILYFGAKLILLPIISDCF